MTAPSPLRPAGSAWTDVVRRPCWGCRGHGGPLCTSCRSLLAGPAGPAHVSPRPAGLPPVHAAASYAGPVREALVAFKDHGRWSLRRPLGEALARAVASALLDVPRVGPVVLVPVAGSPGSSRLRDGDHVAELAAVAARVLREAGADVVVRPALVGVRRRRDQVGLDRAGRAANLAGSVRATPAADRLRGRVVVLVDDLVTSGATLVEAARALAAAGVRADAAAVVASVPRTSGPSAEGVRTAR